MTPSEAPRGVAILAAVSQTASQSRVAFAMAGDARDPAAFSGLPASLFRALSDLGVDMVPVDVEPSGPWQRVLVNTMTLGFLDPHLIAQSLRLQRSARLAFRASKPRLHPSREMAAVRSSFAARRLRAYGPVDRAISFGSEFRLPRGTDYVTLDDATIVQLHRSYAYPWMQAVPDHSLRRMMARQQLVYRKARACCFVSHWAARSALGDYRIAPARVHVVGCGPNRALAPAPREWSTPRFLFVGKDYERKNGPLVLRAFAEVRRHHPSARLDVVGEHPPIDQPGVTGHGLLALDVPSDVEKVNELFRLATCFVMPSEAEPAGYVFAEALAAGIGSIGTTNGGSSTIIGDAGVTVEPGRLAPLTEHMLRFCDPGVAREFAGRARARSPLFTWRAAAERMVRALELPGFDHTGLTAPL